MKPLEGIVVLDLTRFLAGPYCTLLLGGLGAEVIKIEPPDGDPYRNRAPFAGPKGVSLKRQTDADMGMTIIHRARNKKSITLNLRAPKGIELFKELMQKADVIVENYLPGTMNKMGLDDAVLRQWKPSIILCSISGFGQTGPLSNLRAYDPVIQAASGITSITGYPDRPPVRAGAAISDTVTPLMATIGILAALRRRDQTGEGEWLDISMQDASMFLLPEIVEFVAVGLSPQRTGNRHPVISGPFNLYSARDGYVCLCAVTGRDWQNLTAAIGRPDLTDDTRFIDPDNEGRWQDELDRIIEEWSMRHTVTEAVDILQAHRVAAGPVVNLPELLGQAHVAERKMVVDLAHPRHGPIPGAKGLGMPIRFTRNPIEFDQPAPEMSAHNREIYGELLGLGTESIDLLRSAGVI